MIQFDTAALGAMLVLGSIVLVGALLTACPRQTPEEPVTRPDETEEALRDATPTDDVPPYDPESIDYD